MQPLTLMPLPYPEGALAPVTTAQTLALHHGAHHAGYVKKTNELVGADLAKYESLEQLIEHAAQSREDVFDNAGQVWNHDFFWQSMKPAGHGARGPHGAFAEAIERDCGSLEKLLADALARGEKHFGSGWVWIVMNGGKVSAATTANGRPAFVDGLYPLLVCDLWEHAYYLDHQNRRRAFLEGFFAQLANWEFAQRRYEAHEAPRSRAPRGRSVSRRPG
ncbi:MAG: superoxide dismutase [Steroidobacteraceae bacterium]|jgi:Fe-Mn family superoxide dismutase|nr:superoxide dismutase [Steroidobacteraceae bacterium]